MSTAQEKEKTDKEIVEGIKIELLPATAGSGEQCENNRRKKKWGCQGRSVIAVSKRVRCFQPTGCG